MRDFSLNELCAPLAATAVSGDAVISGVSTDSRSVAAGDLFVALQGPNFDGHAFIAAAAERGARAAVVSDGEDRDLPTLRVDDTCAALGRLAAYNRALFTGRLLAITGSCGKTTVKNLLAAILEQRGATLATAGNLNNEIGVPLTLLRLAPEHRFAVVEMGAARAGDIRYLCSLAKPDVSLLLNAMPAHLEGFGSVDAVARAKGEIFEALEGGGTAVINADSEYAGLWRQLAGDSRTLSFGLSEQAGVGASAIEERGLAGSRFRLRTPGGSVTAELALPGIHNVINALAAAAAACAVGVDMDAIARGLAAARPVAGRLCSREGVGGVTVIDDSYNANPGSVHAAIDLLATHAGRRVLLLGSMAELGADSDALHRETGRYAADRGIEIFCCVGAGAEAAVEGFGAGGEAYANRESLLARLPGRFGAGDVVLVKGSRSAGMEVIVNALLDQPGEED
jgi:UDP-N-acetylmuramoyl-tripeptide--D-alanyl-D-alanine ligase